jgi:hypothetical protein
VLELVCTILYVIPRTTVLGAILVSAYLGGAVVTHLRIQEDVFWMPAALGVLAWAGLWLRDERVGALVPLRRGGSRAPPRQRADASLGNLHNAHCVLASSCHGRGSAPRIERARSTRG